MTRIQKTEAQWRSELSPEQYRICRQRGTEVPFTGKYNHHKAEGSYRCACCGHPLFSSRDKFDSGSGWPSFSDVIDSGAVVILRDESHGMVRDEVVCARCDAHLGHVFPDGPEPTGQRYCINSASLEF